MTSLPCIKILHSEYWIVYWFYWIVFKCVCTLLVLTNACCGWKALYCWFRSMSKPLDIVLVPLTHFVENEICESVIRHFHTIATKPHVWLWWCFTFKFHLIMLAHHKWLKNGLITTGSIKLFGCYMFMFFLFVLAIALPN